ncbi:hypothetical protein [Curtobacterium sp. L1-20]|uniref:hypothetical protein n=1 Tax=Curtobacterium sp. L1-20 TaxID=3138181 RepID=UPI003B52797C
MIAFGLALLTLGAIALVRRDPRLIAVALGVGAGLPATAGLAVGGLSVSLFALACVLAAVGWATSRAHGVPSAAATLLVVFTVWSTVAAFFGPWAFQGVPVLLPGNGIDEQVKAPSALVLTSSNVAQPAFLWASTLAVLFLARTGTARAALWTAAWVATTASLARGALKAVGADVAGPVLDTLDVDYAVPGDVRLRGVFAEPSELATFSLGVAVLAVVTVATTTGRQRVRAAVLAVLAAAALLASASGTAVAASGIVLAGLLVVLLLRYVSTRGRGTPWIALGAIVLAITALTVGDRLLGPVLGIVDDKIGSQSYDSRTAADALGLRVLRDTWGLGAGLGSNRSSSFVVTLASTVGVPGVLLFASVVVALVIGAVRHRGLIAATAGLLALLVAKSIAAPDLTTPLLWLLIAAALPVRRPDPDRDLGAVTIDLDVEPSPSPARGRVPARRTTAAAPPPGRRRAAR